MEVVFTGCVEECAGGGLNFVEHLSALDLLPFSLPLAALFL